MNADQRIALKYLDSNNAGAVNFGTGWFYRCDVRQSALIAREFVAAMPKLPKVLDQNGIRIGNQPEYR